MEMSLMLLDQILSMVLMGVMGFIAGKIGILTGEHSRVLSCVSIYIMTPCTLIVSFSSKRDMERIAGLLLAFVAAMLIHILFLAVNALLAKGKYGLTREEQASVIYNNAGSLIMPMVQNVLGLEYVLYTSSYLLVQNMFMWTQGQKLMGGVQKLTLKKILTTPAIMGIVVGMFLFFTGIPIPGVLRSAMEGMSACLAPLAMIVVGVMLAETDMKKVFLHVRIYLVCAVRLLLLPALGLLILVGLNYVWPHNDALNILFVCLLCTVGPAAATITQQAQLYHNPHAEYVASINVLTTLFCVVTIPLMSMLFWAMT